MLKLGRMHRQTGGKVCGPYCNVETNERGLSLLEFATFNNLVLTNTLGPHKPEDGHDTAQMGNTTTRLITSWLRSTSDQELTSIGTGVFLEQTQEVTMTW